MKRLSILGSTGSIGKNTVEVINSHSDKFKVIGLAANNNVQLLKHQIQALRPEAVAVFDRDAAEALRKMDPGVERLAGEEGLVRQIQLSANL